MNKLLVVSHVTHFRHQGLLWAYGPYAREIEVWAELVRQLVIAAPLKEQAPPADCAPIERDNVAIRPIPESGGRTVLAKLWQLLAIPAILIQLIRAMWSVDAIHVRCPGNLGLLGAMLAPLFSRRLIAKYAGQWGSYPGEAISFRMQRAILRSVWWRGPVTVYGHWPNQPAQVVPFFTSVMTERHILRAKCAAEKRQPADTLRVLYVGRLTKSKNVDVLISAISHVANDCVQIACSIVGEGPEQESLQSQIHSLGVRDRVSLLGGKSFEDVLEQYEQSDVLVLASETEGWPKVITEAMAFGMVCIGSDRGLVPTMLGQGRGMVVPPGDVQALRNALREIARDKEASREISQKAAAWAQRFSLVDLRVALGDLMERWWADVKCSASHPVTPCGVRPSDKLAVPRTREL